MAELEGRLEEERQGKQHSDMELNNIQHQLELIIREKESLEQENGRFKQQSQTDLDSLTQVGKFPAFQFNFTRFVAQVVITSTLRLETLRAWYVSF